MIEEKPKLQSVVQMKHKNNEIIIILNHFWSCNQSVLLVKRWKVWFHCDKVGSTVFIKNRFQNTNYKSPLDRWWFEAAAKQRATHRTGFSFQSVLFRHWYTEPPAPTAARASKQKPVPLSDVRFRSEGASDRERNRVAPFKAGWLQSSPDSFEPTPPRRITCTQTQMGQA